jgi:outer membrane protease
VLVDRWACAVSVWRLLLCDMKLTKNLVAILTLTAALAGCTSASLNPTTGEVKYKSSIFQKKISKIDYKATEADGTKRSLTIDGYTSEATSLIDAGARAFESGARAMGKSIVP